MTKEYSMNISLDTIRNIAILLVIGFVTHSAIDGIGSGIDSATSNIDTRSAVIDAATH